MTDDKTPDPAMEVVAEQIRLWWNDTIRKDLELLEDYIQRDRVFRELTTAIVAAIAAAPALCSGCGHEAHDDECMAAPVGEGEPCGCEYRPAAAPALDAKTAPVIDDHYPDASPEMRRGWEAAVRVLRRLRSKEPTDDR